MKSDPEGNSAADAVNDGVNPEENEIAANVKPKAKARKKKVAEVVEASAPETVSEAAPEEVAAKPAGKKWAAKKAKSATPAEEAPAEPAPPKPKAAKKSAKKDKGRDLVVDEPGAEEIAEVLHTPAPVTSTDDEQPEADASPSEPGPAPKLERLQKILAKAGISSRRKAEELILGGRVQINGKVVMELGTKADPARDHVRVDGKLLQGPERIRYFVLNKPKGFVTTVSDPEGRPTVMQFFSSEHERLYPVGRLDYLSEGLLLVTNDGELANKLTKASSGVEKTYLIKVAGQPSEAGLDALRSGVVIERGRGIASGRVRTAPAQIRQVRQGDNPWYEVIVIEGRNRELRKMFEEIGHHVEKIRRIGYGPLILDLEPGKLRELEAEEVHSLRLASEGKLKTRRRRGPQQAQLPTVAGKTVRYKKADGKPGFEPRTRSVPRPEFQTESKAEFKPEFRTIPKSSFKPAFKPEFKSPGRSEARPESRSEGRSEARSEVRSGARPAFKSGARPPFKPGFKPGGKPAFGSGSAGARPGGKPDFGGRGNFSAKPRRAEPPVTDYVLPPRKAGSSEAEFEDKPTHQGSGFNPDYKPGFRAGEKPTSRRDVKPGSRPAFREDGPPKRFGADKPFKSAAPRANFARPAAPEENDFVKTPGFKIEPVEDAPRSVRSGRTDRSDRSAPGGRPFRPRAAGPGGAGFAGGSKPFRPAGDKRPFQPAGDRPAPGGRPFRSRDEGDSRPFRPRPASSSAGPGSAGPGSERSGSGRSGSEMPGRPARDFGDRSSRPPRTGDFRPAGKSRPGFAERPARFTPRGEGGAPAGRPKTFDGTGDRPREFRPRESKGFGGPKKFAASKSFGAKKFDSPKPAPGGRNSVPSGKLGPDGQPRVKVRARDSFVGKNKGRPKPKPKAE
jgi:23S rRNA pseudouridine2605 synthase